MRREKVKALADALGTTPAVIMGWEEPAPDIQLDQSEKRLIVAFRASDPARQGIITPRRPPEVLGIKPTSERSFHISFHIAESFTVLCSRNQEVMVKLTIRLQA
jgi:hypothetical protein